MKKFKLLFVFLAITAIVTAQDTTGTITTIDPDNITALIDTGVMIMDATGNEIIPGVNNTVSGALIALAIREIVALFAKRRRKRKAEAKHKQAIIN